MTHFAQAPISWMCQFSTPLKVWYYLSRGERLSVLNSSSQLNSNLALAVSAVIMHSKIFADPMLNF